MYQGDGQTRADPATHAAVNAALVAARARFGSRIDALADDVRMLLRGRDPRHLLGRDAVELSRLGAAARALELEEQAFARADLARRLDRDGLAVRGEGLS